MSEDKTQAATETVSESPATETTQSGSNEQYIAESKKYRKRAQDAESRLAKLERKLSKAEEAKLKETENYKALYDKEFSKNEGLAAKAEKWANYEEGRREELIVKHPEGERDYLSTLDLKTLEYVTNKINNNAKPNNAPEIVGASKNNVPEKSWSDMTDEEKRAYYTYRANQSKR